MTVATISVTTVLTSALVTEAAELVSSGANMHVELPLETNELKAFVPTWQAATGICPMTIEAVDSDCWTAAKNVRFKQLARDEALGDLSVDELAELNSLTHLRRHEVYPRSV